ncbi:hypothetical protein FB45DRAFT_913765 [Roridomyces roridus]|uniref:Uncharacterized protein n=1 Tax=Roridomyces roridus TaxID=1738132 RepID=A0AAD7FML4_9AGAR|nr:hypothetical protein FB45DRAFT_913765 [Roridomyces roridus]
MLQLICDSESPMFMTIDLAQPMFLFVSGVTVRSDTNAGTFTVDAEQFTSQHGEQRAVAGFAGKSVLPIVGFFPDSPRFRTKKPVPWKNRYVAIGGWLRGISSSLEGETLIERFRVEVEHIAFLGTYTAPATPIASSSSSSGDSDKGPAKKARFSYSSRFLKRPLDDDDSTEPGSSPSPSTSKTTGNAT